jgi:pimeloyl-ACP methyl ester carboxylesterase
MTASRTATSAIAPLAALLVVLGASACTTGGASSVSPSGAASTSAAAPGTSASGGAASASGSAAPGSADIVPHASTLHWQPCGSQLAGLQCTTLQVPLNYADPSGRKITLALDMAPATAPAAEQQGIMLTNPGGPGAPGLSLAAEVAEGISPQVAATYDIVGFDPRGVGSSSPSLTCDPNFFSGVRPDYIPANAAAEQVLISRAKSYAAACEQKFGWFLPYETTVSMARDMDQIRQAFGVKQLTYYGISFGTYLGQVYGTLFPSHVRRMVLDSTVDPTGVWYADNISQDYAFQGRFEAFFAWTAKYDSTYHLGTTTAQVQAAYYKIRAQLEKTPINGPSGPLIGPDELDDTILLGGYLNALWPGFAQALSQYLNEGSSADLIEQFQDWGAQNENEFAVYNAVECADVNWPRNWAKWQSDTEHVYQTAPFEAWDNAWFNAACAFWPVTGPSKPFQVNGAQLPPVLMLQGTLDPATPYAGAQDAHKLLPTARMVVVEGGGNHGQSLESPPDTCVQNYLNSYLATGAVPEKPGLVNATCAPTPDPSPLSPPGDDPPVTPQAWGSPSPKTKGAPPLPFVAPSPGQAPGRRLRRRVRVRLVAVAGPLTRWLAVTDYSGRHGSGPRFLCCFGAGVGGRCTVRAA